MQTIQSGFPSIGTDLEGDFAEPQGARVLDEADLERAGGGFLPILAVALVITVQASC
jgi:hypothetical protein